VEVGVGPPLYTLAALHNGEEKIKNKSSSPVLVKGAWRGQAGRRGGAAQW
jgi:hypothetical protein